MTNVLDKVKNHDESNIQASMLDEEAHECLKYAHDAKKTPAPTPTDTTRANRLSNKRGRNNKVVHGELIDADMVSAEAHISDIASPYPA